MGFTLKIEWTVEMTPGFYVPSIMYGFTKKLPEIDEVFTVSKNKGGYGETYFGKVVHMENHGSKILICTTHGIYDVDIVEGSLRNVIDNVVDLKEFKRNRR